MSGHGETDVLFLTKGKERRHWVGSTESFTWDKACGCDTPLRGECKFALGPAVRSARDELVEHVQPRDETERAIVNALGECSWDECVGAIQRYRADMSRAGGG